MAAPRLGFAGRRVRDTANPAGFIAPPVTYAAFAAHEYAPSGLHELWATICYNCRLMNKGLIYPDECYAIRGAIYEVHNEMGGGFKEATGFVIPFVKIRVRRNIPRAKRAAPAVARGVPHS